MDHAEDSDNNDDVFIYMGGSVPQHLRETITHARVHKSVKIITRDAFHNCRNLVSIEMHDGVEIIEKYASKGLKFIYPSPLDIADLIKAATGLESEEVSMDITLQSMVPRREIGEDE